MADHYLTWLKTVLTDTPTNGHNPTTTGDDPAPAELAHRYVIAAQQACQDGDNVECLLFALLAGQAHQIDNVSRLEQRLVRIEQSCPGLGPQ